MASPRRPRPWYWVRGVARGARVPRARQRPLPALGQSEARRVEATVHELPFCGASAGGTSPSSCSSFGRAPRIAHPEGPRQHQAEAALADGWVAAHVSARWAEAGRAMTRCPGRPAGVHASYAKRTEYLAVPTAIHHVSVRRAECTTSLHPETRRASARVGLGPQRESCGRRLVREQWVEVPFASCLASKWRALALRELPHGARVVLGSAHPRGCRPRML